MRNFIVVMGVAALCVGLLSVNAFANESDDEAAGIVAPAVTEPAAPAAPVIAPVGPRPVHAMEEGCTGGDPVFTHGDSRDLAGLAAARAQVAEKNSTATSESKSAEVLRKVIQDL